MEGEDASSETQQQDNLKDTAVVTDIQTEIGQIAAAKKEEVTKKRADDLWADFLKDVGGSKAVNSSRVIEDPQKVGCVIAML